MDPCPHVTVDHCSRSSSHSEATISPSRHMQSKVCSRNIVQGRPRPSDYSRDFHRIQRLARSAVGKPQEPSGREPRTRCHYLISFGPKLVPVNFLLDLELPRSSLIIRRIRLPSIHPPSGPIRDLDAPLVASLAFSSHAVRVGGIETVIL
jgi:hypothetical protein